MIPKLDEIFKLNPVQNITSLGEFLSGLFNIALYLAVFMAFYWLVWGAFQYMTAQGKKEDLNKAKERIKWALAGLIVVFASYFIAKYAGQFFAPGKGGLPF